MKKAIELLNDATSVAHYNLIRNKVKLSLSQDELARIDGSGICGKIVKKDKRFDLVDQKLSSAKAIKELQD